MSSRAASKTWCVRVTGLSPDATTFDLSNQFELTVQRIRIPEPQAYSSECDAFIDGFRSERAASVFVSEWNEVFERNRIGMRCELNTAVTDESSVRVMYTEDNNSYRSQGTTHSKKRTPCLYGDRCFTVDCPYKHSPEWHVCDDGAQCNDFDCTANHPRNRQTKCKYASACRNRKSGCSYLHPGVSKPKRLFDNDDQNHQRHIRHSSNPSKVHGEDDERTHFYKQRLVFQSDDEDLPRAAADRRNRDQSPQQRQHFKSVKIRMAERKSARLPIFTSYTEFCKRLLEEKVLVVVADSNSCSSTQLPQYAAECCPDGLVVCTQPRATAAMALARRVAAEYDGTSEGNSVGYKIGNGNNQVAGTNIMFMTDAALIYECQVDSTLSRIRVLIIDEVHERSLNTDIVLGIAKLLLAKRKTDFYVVISLTTINPEPFLKFFHLPSSSALCIENRTHSVTVENLPPLLDCLDYKFIEHHVLPTLLRFYPKHAKHTLVFLPGQREIGKALEIFTKDIPDDCIALPFYGSIPLEEQEKILEFEEKHSSERMVLFCTNIPESSLVMKNVQLVIDTGLVRQLRFDRQHQTNVLQTVRISRFSADQRRDLAGYSKRGQCIRLYNDDELKDEDIEPEILYSALDLVLLQLKRLHLDPQTFPFITEPDPVSMLSSLDYLESLLCLDKEKKITKRGKLFAELSVSPRLCAFMINVYTETIESERLLSLVATIVAILSGPGSFFSMNETMKDLNDRIRHSATFSDDQYNSDLLYICAVFDEWKAVGAINQTTKKCITCRQVPKHQSNVCQTCRAHHSLINGLNHQVLQVIETAIEFYIKTITSTRWKLTSYSSSTSTLSNEGEIIGEHLQKLFPAQLGHLLVPHLPDEGVRLLENDLRASIANRSLYVQRAHDQVHQYFVAMSIARSSSGGYIVDCLHQVSAHQLPASPVKQLLTRENIGWSTSNEVRILLNGVRSETWAKWLVHEYDRLSRQLTIWGLPTDQSHLDSVLQPIFSHTHSKAIECGPIRATFQNGLICVTIEIMENALRLNLQRVPCKNYAKLQVWLKTKLNISRHDIRENNFQEHVSKSSDDDDDDDDGYEAPPFYIVLKSTEAFQRATTNLAAHYICSQEALSSSTTGTHMSEKDAWGRQLVLTIPLGGTFITAKELLTRLTPHAVDCRQFGKRSIRVHPGIQLVNLPRDADELFVQQILQPITPLKISLRKTHRDGTGSSSVYIFFTDNRQRQQAITNLQSDFCQKPVTITVRSRTRHQHIQKQVVPTLSELKSTDPVPFTFLITAINRESALQLYKEIIPKMESSWQVDSSATVTVTHPHLYPDFDTLIQQIANQFETEVHQQPIDQKQPIGRSPVRCFFNHGTPQKTALAASMLAQSTSPIIIKMTTDRQKQLFEELFSTGIIQDWSSKLNLETIKKERSSTWIEIRGPQVQQGQLMQQIADYSDTFDVRFRVLELNSTIANFFGRRKLADNELQTLSDTWSNWGCHVKYASKTKSIIIYAQPSTKVSFLDSCETEVKRILSKLSVDGKVTRDQQKCVFCEKISYSTNTLRLCGHAYCRCASSHLIHTIPLQCHEPKCKMNIDMQDLFEIFSEREALLQVCKKSIQIYFENNSSTYDQRFCPNPPCYGLVKQSGGYQTCLTCGRSVCSSCSVVDDDSHQGRTCAERTIFQNMSDFLPTLFKAAEKFARDNWVPQTPPIIRIDYNMALTNPCPSMQRFYKGVEALNIPSPPDMTRGFFSFHGTAPAGIKPICNEGFDPKRRAGQAHGPGEYFGVTSAVSHGYSCRDPHGPYSMIIALLLNCPQLSTRAGFCHVMNNPTDWSHAFNLPVVVVSYGTQSSCNSPLAS